MNNRAICVIPARGGSKGIRNKNLVPVCGLPLVAWSIKQAIASGVFEEVVVDSDSDDILACANEFGACISKRPPEFAQHDTTHVETMLNWTERWNVTDDEVIVMLQPTNPLRKLGDLENAVCITRTLSYPGCYTVVDASAYNLWTDNGLVGGGMGRLPRQKRQPVYRETGSIYSWRGLEILPNSGVYLYKVESWQAHDIDEPGDIEVIEYWMRKKGLCSNLG